MSAPVDENGFSRTYRNFTIFFPAATLLVAVVLYWLSAKSSSFPELVQNISYSLAAAAIATFFSLFFGFKYFLRDYKEHEDNKFADLVASKVADNNSSGVMKARERLDTEFASRMIKGSKSTLIIETWIDKSTLADMEDALKEAFRKKKEIHIILLHPNSPQVIRRGVETSNAGDMKINRRFIIETILNIQKLKNDWIKHELESRNEKNKLLGMPYGKPRIPKIRVSCYDCLPPLQIYMWRDVALVGFYLQGKASSEGYQLEVDLNKGFGIQVRKHVDLFLKKGNLIKIDLNSDIKNHFKRNI